MVSICYVHRRENAFGGNNWFPNEDGEEQEGREKGSGHMATGTRNFQ